MAENRRLPASNILALAQLGGMFLEFRERRVAKIKAAALREAADEYDGYLSAGGDPNYLCMWLRQRADRIENGPVVIKGATDG